MVLFGPDGARYQEGIRVPETDWDRVSFGAWRAIHQSGNPDRTFPVMREQFRAHKKPFAAYVWVDGMPAETKASYTAKAINDTTIPIMVDWEDSTCPFPAMVKYIAAMRARGYRVTLLYTGRYFHASMGNPDLTKLGVDLVIARYGNQSDTGSYDIEDRYSDMLAKYSVWEWNVGGLKPSMWQYGSQIRWGDQEVDMNAIRDPRVIERAFTPWATPTPVPTPVPTPQPPGDDVELIKYAEMVNLWTAPGAADVADGGTSDRWLNAIILKVGAIADVQQRNGLKVTGRYDQPTAEAYLKELTAMKAAAGA